MRAAILLAALAPALVGCSAVVLGNPDVDGGNLVAPACHWPASLNDPGRGGCWAGPALVECTDAMGDRCDCVTDQTTCDCGQPPSTCQDLCGPNQYAVHCGSPGPAGPSPAAPPAACTARFLTPAGVAYYCCPCA